MPFGSGFGGYSAARRWTAAGRGRPGFENFNFGNGETADLSDLFEGLFGGATGRGGPAAASGFRQRARAPQKGADVAYRLRCRSPTRSR